MGIKALVTQPVLRQNLWNVFIKCKNNMFLNFWTIFFKMYTFNDTHRENFLLKPVQKFINHSFPMQPFFTHCGVEKVCEERVEKGCIKNHWK